jgi:hypothetical protein
MQTTEKFTQRWTDLGTGGSAGVHQHYDADHPLRLFFGYDVTGERIFFLITNEPPKIVPEQSHSIQVTLSRRQDGYYTIMLRLLEAAQYQVFAHLCWDLAEFTRSCSDDARGVITFIERFKKWQRLLQRGRDGLLSGAQIKGLVGELLFMEQYLFNIYGTEKSIKGWLGPTGADQDFVFEDYWYEVKAVDPGVLTVKISSLEQLDNDANGQLGIVLLEKTSDNHPSVVSLNSMIERIRDRLSIDMASLSLFEKRLEEIGYIDSKEYSEDLFVLHKIRRFMVADGFPRIRRSMVAPAVARVTYELSIGSISIHELI